MTRLMKGPASYFTRYSNRVVMAHWNERREALLTPFAVSPGQAAVRENGVEYKVHWNGDRPEVAAAVAAQGDDALSFSRRRSPTWRRSAPAPGCTAAS